MPSQQEIGALVSLFNQRRYIDAELMARSMTEDFPQHGLGWQVLGAVFRQTGRNADALAPMQKAAALSPNYPEVHYNLGNTLKELGRLGEAEASYRRALEIKPDYAEAHGNLGVTLNDLGRLDEAEVSCRHALQIKPDYAEAHYNLGNTLKGLGKIGEVESCYRRASEIKPDYAKAHYSLGNTLKELGRLEESEACYRRVLQIKPDFAEAHYNLGNVMLVLGQIDDAVVSYRRVLEINPEFSEAHNNLGFALQGLGQFDAAAASYCRALEIKPEFAEAYNNLGSVLQDLRRFDDAAASYRRALEIRPEFVDAHSNLGTALKNLRRLNDAAASYRRALEIKPEFAEAHRGLGDVLRHLGQLDDAEASYRRALEIKPTSLSYAAQTHLLLPCILESNEAIASWRERYQTGISVLASGDFDDDLESVNPLSFFLAYHNQADKLFMEALQRMFRSRVTGLTDLVHSRLNQQATATLNRRIRIGFLSEYLVDHTIGKLFMGFIRHLDRRQFEVVIIHAPKARHDGLRQIIDTSADKVLTLPRGLKDQQAAVMAECLDVLFYPDIGMSSATYFLAYARLAPVQAVSWGHPDTTGLDSVDYFISSASIEPPDADEHYTERLIRLNRMPCYYQPPAAPTPIPARQVLGLPEAGTLYGCPQSLFKFHPDFDSVLALIAEGDPDGHIVLIDGDYVSWTNLLKARWAITYPILLARVIFLPKMPPDRFMSLMAHIDILLDPLYFGSGNTMYEAMVYGTPIVTWPGKFMRGRIVAGCYKQMGIKNPPIAECLEDYAKMALVLGLDPERRRVLRKDILDAADKELFADMGAVREFEAFLEASVAAARSGGKLPLGWQPGFKAQ